MRLNQPVVGRFRRRVGAGERVAFLIFAAARG